MLVLLMSLQAAAPDELMQKGRAANIVWETCVEVIAESFAKGTDSAGDIATAALYKCRPVQDEFVSAYEAIIVSKLNVGTQRAKELVQTKVAERVEEMRGAAIAAVLKYRTSSVEKGTDALPQPRGSKPTP